MKSFNDRVGDRVSFWLSTMTAFWIVTAFVLIPLIWQRPVGLIGWVQFLIQSLFQGSALPVLGYVSRVSGEKQEQVLRETHDTVMDELSLVKEELSLAREERDELKTLVAELHTKIPEALASN